MASAIKNIVSKNKKRFQEGEFDLDLSYITSRVIAMGFPAQKLEGVYRNNMEDVVRFLETKHKNHYKIYNLCTERKYDACKFQQRVAHYPFDDHQPPRLELIRPFCEDVTQWLDADADNVAAVHCKAGKGRTGVMICSYLLHSEHSATSADALCHYAKARTEDDKGVTIPSQCRYVDYYAKLLRTKATYRPRRVALQSIEIPASPIFFGNVSNVFFVVTQINDEIYTSPIYEIRKGDVGKTFDISDGGLTLVGDIRIELYKKSSVMVKKREKLFQFWFNTYFVEPDVGSCVEEKGREICVNRVVGSCASRLKYVFSKGELDKAHKDKGHRFFPPHFKVCLRFVESVMSGPPAAVDEVDGGGGREPPSRELRPPQQLMRAVSYPPATLQRDDDEEEEMEAEGAE